MVDPMQVLHATLIIPIHIRGDSCEWVCFLYLVLKFSGSGIPYVPEVHNCPTACCIKAHPNEINGAVAIHINKVEGTQLWRSWNVKEWVRGSSRPVAE
jgi:hypothetical protein